MSSAPAGARVEGRFVDPGLTSGATDLSPRWGGGGTIGEQRWRRIVERCRHRIVERDRPHAAGYIKKWRGTNLLLTSCCSRLTAYNVLVTAVFN